MARFHPVYALGAALAIIIEGLLVGLAAPVAAQDSGWEAPAPIRMNKAENSIRPQVAVNSEGTSPVVTSGWGAPVPIGRTVAEAYWGSADDPRIVMDTRGNALAVWTQWHGSSWGVWANRYESIIGWGDPTPIGTGSTQGFDPQIATDSLGNAMVVWMQLAEPGSAWSIWANRYMVGTGWGVASTIESSSYAALTPEIAIDPEGNAFAVWIEESATNVNIWTNRYIIGQGWGTPSPLEIGPVYAYEPQVAVTPQGNAMVLWRQWNATRYDLWSRGYAMGTGWGPAVPVSTSEGSIEHKIVADHQGNFIAVWEQGDRPRRIWANRYIDGAGWQNAVPVSLSGLDAASADVGLDAAGNAIVVSKQSNGASVDVWSNQYVVNQGWGNPSFVGSGTTDLFTVDMVPQVAVDPGGNATVVWERPEFRGHGIWANRYTAGTGWGLAEPIETGPGNAQFPRIVADPQGNSLAIWSQRYGPRDHIWSNRFIPGVGWGPATMVERKTGIAFVPQTSMDGQGSAVTVWSQGDGAGYSILSNRYSVGSGWGSPNVIDGGQADAIYPHVETNGGGDAIAVWEKREGGRNGIWASRYVLGWTKPMQIDSSSQDAYAPRVSVDGSGDAIAVWQQWTGLSYGIWASRYDVRLGWDTATPISVGAVGDGHIPHVVSDLFGNAVAVWEQWDGARDRIWANVYVVGVGWGAAAAIDSGTADVGTPQTAVDALGNAIVVWEQSNVSQPQPGIWWNRFTAGAGWSGASAFATGPGWPIEPQIAMDRENNAIVVWGEVNATDPTANSVIRGNRYVAGAGWGATTTIATTSARVRTPHIAIDDQGRAFAIWRESDDFWGGGPYDILALRYIPDGGWGNATLIGTVDVFDSDPQLAVDSSGNATVVWSTWDEIWATRYVANPFLPDLVIWAPTTALTNKSVVTVTGRTTPGAVVFVDCVSVVVDPTGVFSYSAVLPEGPHVFVIEAMTEDGAVNVKTVTVMVDTIPPELTIAIPISNLTTNDGVVTVSGTTEPSAQLVVNGLSAAVSHDGSFFVRVGLAEGPNTIVATATDAAGNVATASATVIYVNPLVQDLALVRWVAIGSSLGVVALASLLIALYQMRWLRGARRPEESRNGLRTEDPNDASSSAIDAQSRANGGVLVHALAADRRWPAKATSGPVRLTAKERILLHLLHFVRYADASEVPRELTQERVVEAAGIDRRHLAQYVHPLVRDGLVRERTARVRGVVQRRRVYVLTEEGRSRALGVRDRIRSAVVRVRDMSGVREVTVAEALLEARGSMSVLDILRESIETGVVDLVR